MIKGVDDFQGHRLQKALDARMFNATTLSELSGISSSMISQLINNKKTPSFETLHSISKTLNLPETYFLKEKIHKEHPVFYRKFSSATKTIRNSVDVKLEWISELFDFVEKFVELPKLNFPRFEILDRKEFHNLSNLEIEEIATETREYWGLGKGVIPNVTLLLENNGYFISRTEIGADNLDALFKFDHDKNRAFILLSTDKQSPSRSKFDVSHELGHSIIHRNINSKVFSLKKHHDLLEDQANRFAGAFLLPAESFTRDFTVPTLDTFRALKKKWGVSIAFMIVRAFQLDLINERTYKNMWINYSRRGWRKNEPFDDQLEFEKPTIIKRSIQLILENNLSTPDDIINEVGISENDIEILSNMDKGYLNNHRKPGEKPKLRLIK